MAKLKKKATTFAKRSTFALGFTFGLSASRGVFFSIQYLLHGFGFSAEP